MMKVNTVIKLGTLAFGVVRNEKVQELFKMAHSGAKRRGIIGQFQGSSGGSPKKW